MSFRPAVLPKSGANGGKLKTGWWHKGRHQELLCLTATVEKKRPKFSSMLWYQIKKHPKLDGFVQELVWL